MQRNNSTLYFSVSISCFKIGFINYVSGVKVPRSLAARIHLNNAIQYEHI
jgi:hypothetical protein